MTTSIHLGIPYISTNQSQPDVTHNDALVMIQVLLSAGVWQVGLNTPPGDPENGDAYIVGTSPTDIWVGKENVIAAYYQDQWYYIPGFDSNGSQIEMGENQVGLKVWSRPDNDFYIWTDTGSPSTLAWTAAGFGGGGISGIDVKDENSTVVSTATILDFQGEGVVVTDEGGGEALITIAEATVEVSDGGSPEVVSEASAIDFTGVGVTVTDTGGGRANVNVDAPYDFGVFFSGLPTASQEIFRMEAVRGFTIPDGAPGSTANAAVESTGTAVFSIRKNGVQFATVTWVAGSPTDNTGTWAFDAAADESFVAGDLLTMVAPDPADATLEDIAIFVKGARD